MTGRMEGRKAVVVGAGQPQHEQVGNGRAIALTLAREGAEVCAVDREADRAEETVAMIRDAGGTAHVIVADVSVPDDCARIVAEAVGAMGWVDALCNNVGASHCDADPLELDVAGWQELMDINLRATWLTSRAAVPVMRDHGGGTITNTSTVGSITGGGNLFAYSISKAGVNAVTHFFAVQYAPWKIRCNAILPSWILTPHSLVGLERAGVIQNAQQLIDHGANAVPLGRMGTAWDVANAALYLSSDESCHTTGLEIPVDGGTLAIIGHYAKPEAKE
jgi:NAD(P)-dependent dehydrogenase (short-subunit alcohol dehydrogenase family)